MPQRLPSTLEGSQRLTIRRPAGALTCGLATVHECLVPQLTAEGVASEPLDLFSEATRPDIFDRSNDARVKRAALALEQARISDFKRQSVLERVLEIGEQRRFVQELGGLETREPGPELFLAGVRDRLEQRERDVLADHSRRLQQALVLLGQPINARSQHRLHGCRNLDRLGCASGSVPTSLTDQRTGLHEGSRALLEKERVPFGALDQQPLDGVEARVVAEQRAEEVARTLRRQRIYPELVVVGLSAPAVRVLRPVVHEQEDAGGWKAVDQSVEERLG